MDHIFGKLSWYSNVATLCSTYAALVIPASPFREPFKWTVGRDGCPAINDMLTRNDD